MSAYDRYVRPFVLPGDDPLTGADQNHPLSNGGGSGGIRSSADAGPQAGLGGTGVDKGKARDVSGGTVGTPAGGLGADGDHGDLGDMDDEDGGPGSKGEKKRKNSYKHLIKGVPGTSHFGRYRHSFVSHAPLFIGKHSFKKDESLQKVMLVPPKQHIRIRQFDYKTQEDAFAVSLEGLKSVCILFYFIYFPSVTSSFPAHFPSFVVLIHHSLSSSNDMIYIIVERQYSYPRVRTGPRGPEKTGTFFVISVAMGDSILLIALTFLLHLHFLCRMFSYSVYLPPTSLPSLSKQQKELKRLAKLQAQNGQLPLQTPLGTTNSVPSTPLPGVHTPSVSASTPVTVHAPVPTVANGRRLSAAQPGSNKTGGSGTPRPVGTPRQGISTPRPGSTNPSTSNNLSSNVNVNNGPSNVSSNTGPGGGVSGGHGTTTTATTTGPPMGNIGVSRPTSTVPRPGSTVPRPGSAVPRPGSGKPPTTQAGAGQQQQQRSGSNVPLRTGTPMDVDRQQQLQRGKKREREDGSAINHGNGAVNGHANGHGMVNGNGSYHQQPQQQQQQNVPLANMNMRAGSGNIRPRPSKKQKLVRFANLILIAILGC